MSHIYNRRGRGRAREHKTPRGHVYIAALPYLGYFDKEAKTLFCFLLRRRRPASSWANSAQARAKGFETDARDANINIANERKHRCERSTVDSFVSAVKERLCQYLLCSFFCFSEKLDIEKNSVGPGGIPADAIYTTTPRTGVRGGHHSPDAMKVRLAAMVLQPPTRV